jgi:hypothetical protein
VRVDKSKSAYQEADEAKAEFTRVELRRCRLLLRRLRFLEAQVSINGGVGGESGGAAFAEWEVEALEWILDEIGFLKRVSGNNPSNNDRRAQ